MKRLLLTFALIFAFVCAQAADITSISNAFKANVSKSRFISFLYFIE